MLELYLIMELLQTPEPPETIKAASLIQSDHNKKGNRHVGEKKIIEHNKYLAEVAV